MLGDGAEFFVYFFFFFFLSVCLFVCLFVFFISFFFFFHLFKKNICYFIVCSFGRLMIVVCGYGLLVYIIKFVVMVMVWWLLFMLLHLLVGYMYV